MIAVVLSIAMILMDYRGTNLTPIRTTLNIILHPLIYAVDVPFRTGAYVANFFRDQSKIIEENRKLTSLVRRYAVRDQKYHSIAQENLRFRKQLNAAEAIEERFQLAEILSVSRDQYRNTVTIDKGMDDGLYRGQVVLSGQSIYGQVYEVAKNSAVILQLTDSKHAIPVRNNRTGLGAIAVGSGNTNQLELKNIEANIDIKEGDTFYSSGLGQLFPADFPVATVRSVAYNPGDSFMRVTAQTKVDFSKSREVILIWRSNHLTVLRAEEASAEKP